MNLARIGLIVVALGIALLTAFLVRGYLSQVEQTAAENGKPEEQAAPAVEILIASRELAAGTLLSGDSLRWQPWPEQALNENYIRRDGGKAIDDYIDWAVRRALAAGEPVLESKLVKPGTGGFMAGVLPPGMRAVSVKVKPETSAAGFILPGSRVDVIMTQEIQQETNTGINVRRVVSETVLRDVEVLAIDQQVSDIEGNAQLSDTVTLAVTTKQAESLAVADELGDLSLSLRSVARDPESDAREPYTSDDQVSTFLSQGSAAARRVLIARHDLPANSLLRDTDLSWQQLPEGTDTAGMIVEANNNLASLRGAYLKYPRQADQIIGMEDVIRPGEQGFIVAALAPGMRAVSIAVSQATGVSGYVSPGDRVDVLMTHEIEDSAEEPILSPRRYAETIVRNVRLLAIEQTVDDSTGKPVIGTTATVEVSARQSEALALGASMGKLSLALRSVPSVDVQDLNGEPYTSDLAISRATVDFIVSGTGRAPQVIERIGSVNETQNGAIPRQIRVYRSTVPSQVIVGGQ